MHTVSLALQAGPREVPGPRRCGPSDIRLHLPRGPFMSAVFPRNKGRGAALRFFLCSFWKTEEPAFDGHSGQHGGEAGSEPQIACRVPTPPRRRSALH